MVRVAKRPNARKQQVVVAEQIPAPIGGWDTQSPLAAMPKQNAVILDNWIPRSGFVEMRRGFIPQQTGTPAAVESLIPFRGDIDGDLLFAASGGNLYDVTDQGAPLGAPVHTGATSNRWNYTAFANPAGPWTIAVNGADAPIGYNGGAWAALPTISGTVGSIVLDPTKLFCVAGHKGRLLYGELGTLHVWFPAAAAVGGVMGLLDLGSIFSKGGRLVAIQTWSWQFGVTADDFAVFMTDQGQIAIYQGADPSDATSWELTGVYDFGEPIGQKALVKYGADLVAVTTDGIIPLSQALKLDRDEQNSVALTAKIREAFAQAVRAYRKNYGWQAILYPGDTTSDDQDAEGGALIIFNVPVTELGTSQQFVQNATTGAWCRFPSGIDAFCWETANDCIYFGGAAGVYQWDIGASDDGQIITADVLAAYSTFGVAKTKRFTMLRPLMNVSGLVQPALDMNIDYQNTAPTAVPTVVDAGSTTPEIRFDWTSVGGIGYVGAPRMVVALKDDPSQPLLAVDVGLTDVLAVDGSDLLAVESGLPYDVPCQLIGFDVMFEVGGQL